MSSDFKTGLDLVADVLLNPIFPAGDLERERDVQIAGIYAQKDDLLKSAALPCAARCLAAPVMVLIRWARKTSVHQTPGRRPEIVSPNGSSRRTIVCSPFTAT